MLFLKVNVPAEVELPVQMEVREMVVSTEHRACFISGFRDLEKYPCLMNYFKSTVHITYSSLKIPWRLCSV